jgi:hypothetical protein
MTRSRQETERLQALTVKRWGPRSRWVCVYCGRPARQIDHFMPEAGGGTNDAWNLMPGCESCNRAKSNHDPIEWMKAVGVPFHRANLLWKMYHFLGRPADLIRDGLIEFPRITLDYGPGHTLPRLDRAKRGAKGA